MGNHGSQEEEVGSHGSQEEEVGSHGSQEEVGSQEEADAGASREEEESVPITKKVYYSTLPIKIISALTNPSDFFPLQETSTGVKA